MQYQWAEDDFDVPAGVGRLGLSAPIDGRKYVMYHGTTKGNADAIRRSGFHQSADGMLGRGVYLSRDLQKASRYPIDHPESDRAVIKVLVDVGRVIVINRQNHPHQKTWHDHDYDTAWVPPNCGMVKSGLEEDCVWDPNRIQITKIIKPLPVQSSSGYGAHGYKDTDTNMQYQWAEDDFDVPAGVGRLGLSAPIDGRKYVMYHGTTKGNAETIRRSGFRQSADGMLGRGVYLSRDLQKASRYPIDHPESDRAVIKVLVSVGKVIAINRQNHPHQKTWHNYGYDTAWVPPNCGMVKSGLEEDCVWDPNRIQITKIIKPLPQDMGQLGLSAPVSGRKYIMYHGTTKRAAQSIMWSGFQQSTKGMLGRGVYLSRDLQKASRYPIDHPESDRAVIKVLVDVGKVIAINRQNHPHQKTWHDLGYDTAWVPPNCGMVKSGLEEDCVWDPNRIQIIKIINPLPTNMNQQQTWAEDDFDAPVGVTKLGQDEPVSGREYIMYHGTTKQNAKAIQKSGFRQSAGGMLGRGVYLSRDLQKASRYPISHPESDRAVLRVKVNVGKVIAIKYQNHPDQKTWHDLGYDTAWVPPNCGMVKSGLEEDCVWDPNRIQIMNIINPTPVQRPRPVQPSSSWSGCSYSGWLPPCQENYWPQSSWMGNSWMFPHFQPMMQSPSSSGTSRNQLQWLEDDSDLSSEVGKKSSSGKKTTGKKTTKPRATTSKKKEKK
ncbi:grass carp reovirus (GCRV)-induced gene 2e [Acanthopagrus latus]|uniref:grass carp reovirus (GCRV)-induced gene 2e n=1 Tax=Acanthopagrus latus TaxID=8177 RepID=UPI00187CDEA5|nr:grass carp reovirus (GCRV)-induced gene 2e [Acanthopagrus latus]